MRLCTAIWRLSREGREASFPPFYCTTIDPIIPESKFVEWNVQRYRYVPAVAKVRWCIPLTWPACEPWPSWNVTEWVVEPTQVQVTVAPAEMLAVVGL